MTDAPLEYERAPIPHAVLVDPTGADVTLARLAERRAVLLVFPGPNSTTRGATLRALGDWPDRMTLVDIRLVLPDTADLGDGPDHWRERLLRDPHGQVHAQFGPTDRPLAVLLGADGALAGGPVSGADAIGDLVEAVAARLREAYGDALRPATAISGKCITYGRVEYLEEALESFLRQEYAGEHELVIVNDYPRQRLHFDHPRVRIINLDFTFETIGEKENFAVSACRHDVVAVWDDDDIALPHHLGNIDRFIPGHDLLHWERGVSFTKDRITGLTSLGNSGIAYRKTLWREVGGHPMENAGYDVTFVNRLLATRARVVKAEPAPDEVSWFYRWRHGSYHMSGHGTDHPGRPDVVQRHVAHIESLREAGRIPTGDIELRPHWRSDYAAMLADFRRDQRAGAADEPRGAGISGDPTAL